MSKLFWIITCITIQNTWALKYYHPYENINNMTFEVRSNEVSSFLKNKFLNMEKTPFLKVYYAKPSRLYAELVDAESIEEKFKIEIEKYFTKKFKLLIESDLDKFLGDYKKIESSLNEAKYEDNNGILSFQEIFFNREGANDVKVILKKPLGTHIINYSFSPKNRYLKKVKKREYEGIGSLELEIDFSYEKIGNRYLPNQIKTTIEQTMRGAEEDYQISRSLSEVYELGNYSLDKNEALKWFSKNPKNR